MLDAFRLPDTLVVPFRVRSLVSAPCWNAGMLISLRSSVVAVVRPQVLESDLIGGRICSDLKYASRSGNLRRVRLAVAHSEIPEGIRAMRCPVMIGDVAEALLVVVPLRAVLAQDLYAPRALFLVKITVRQRKPGGVDSVINLVQRHKLRIALERYHCLDARPLAAVLLDLGIMRQIIDAPAVR